MSRPNPTQWFKFFHKWGRSILEMENEEAGQLIKAICEIEIVYSKAYENFGTLPDADDLPKIILPRALQFLWNDIEDEIANNWYYMTAGKTGGIKAHSNQDLPGVHRGVHRGVHTKEQEQQKQETRNKIPEQEQQKQEQDRLSAVDVGLLLSEGYTETEIENAAKVTDWHKMRSGSAASYIRGVMNNIRKQKTNAQQYSQRDYMEQEETLEEMLERLNREGV